MALIKVRVTSPIPKFISPRPMVVGPFVKGQVITCDEDLAALLIRKNRAEAI